MTEELSEARLTEIFAAEELPSGASRWRTATSPAPGLSWSHGLRRRRLSPLGGVALLAVASSAVVGFTLAAHLQRGNPTPVPVAGITPGAPATPQRSDTATGVPTSTPGGGTPSVSGSPGTAMGGPTPIQTVLPSTPPPLPLPGGWPGSNSTGVPAGTVLTPSGSITVTTVGAVVDAKNVSGCISVQADNVTIKRTLISGGGGCNYSRIDVRPGITGVTIQDVEINGLNQGDQGIGGGGSFTILRSNIHGMTIGVVADVAVTVQDSWIHALQGGSANDIDSTSDNSGITLRHNRLENSSNADSVVALYADSAPGIQNVILDDNLLNGGGWTLSAGCAGPSGGLCQNISVTNNHFMRTPESGAFFASGGAYGPVTAFNNSGTQSFMSQHQLTWSGNVWDDNGVTVPY